MTILDSNIWIAFFYESDSQHKKAEEIIRKLGAFIIVPEYVVVEVSSILRFNAGEKISNMFLDGIFDNENIDILPSDENFFNSVVENFKNCENKKLSFVDTALLCLSESYNIITFDKDLQKAINKNNKELF